MKKIYILVIASALLASCGYFSKQKVTDPKDYQAYLQSEPIDGTSKYFRLWNSKIRPDSLQLMSFGIVAGQYHSYFEDSGEIGYLKKSEKALERAVEIAAVGKADYLRALARNYISQHRFREALGLTHEARELGSGILETQYLYFDLYMELGEYSKAEHYLDSTRNMAAFGYLIRLAKWNDHQGDLETTIRLMETATKKAENSRNKASMLWSYTNIADYYGHAGRIKESYDHYLKALALDPDNAYAKKGIAWIVYSHEGNPEEALRILEGLGKYYQAPDIELLKAEIAEYTGKSLDYIRYMEAFLKRIENADYGDMYNAYAIDIFVNDRLQYREAVELAEREVRNRPTPMTYSSLAYSYFKEGKSDKAYELIFSEVIGKTQEPVALLRVAEILKARGDQASVRELKNSLMEASYELGPVTTHRVMAL
jgi:tetratricopeptide (TPR) repeat protein